MTSFLGNESFDFQTTHHDGRGYFLSAGVGVGAGTGAKEKV